MITKLKKHPLHISFISHSAAMGGAERALLEIIDGFLEKGIICSVVLPEKGILEAELKKRSLKVIISPYSRWTKNAKNEKRDEDIFAQQIAHLTNVLKDINPDILYSNSGVIDAGAMIAKLLYIPHIWHIHEFGEIDHQLIFQLERSARAKFISKNSDLVIFNSKAVQKYYQPEISAEKSVVAYNNVAINIPNEDKTKYFFQGNSWKLLIIGSIQTGKGQKDAILATKKLLEKGENVELLIIGQVSDKNYFEELKQLVSQNKLENNITFHDYINNPLSALMQADVLLVCSKNEAFGRVTAEAMLLKKPVIATRSGGTPELVTDHKTGLLYTAGDIAQLVDNIEKLLNDRAMATSYGENGFSWAKQNLTFDACFGQIIPIFYSLTSTKNIARLKCKKITDKIKNITHFVKMFHKVVKRDGFFIACKRTLETAGIVIGDNAKKLK